jgi:phospholipid/cholesterol/gamma-HCH transport system substrate-binding protein
MAVAVYIISGYYGKAGVNHWIEFDESVLGLYEGAIVEYLGVPVGKVNSIRVTPQTNRPHVEVTIDPETVQLYKGVQAQMVLYSLAAGTMAISLTGGEPELGPLPPNSQIPTRTSTFAAISGRMETIMETITSIADAVDTGLAGMQEGDLKAVIDNANGVLEEAKTFIADGRSVVDTANQAVSSVQTDANRVVDELMTISEEMKPLIRNMDELVVTANGKLQEFDVQRTTENLDRVLENIGDLSERLNSTVEQLDDMTANVLHEADNIEYTLRNALSGMSDALDTMRLFVEQIARDPSSIIRGKGEVKENE